MQDCLRVVVDEDGDFQENYDNNVVKYLKDGWKILTITTAVAGMHRLWHRHYFWLTKEVN